MSHRLQRLNAQIRQEISEVILRQLRDPRLAELVTITRVEASADLKLAKVYISVMGSDDDKLSTLEGLTAAAAFIRHELTDRISIRRMPNLTFVIDESIEEAAHILKIMDNLSSDSLDEQ